MKKLVFAIIMITGFHVCADMPEEPENNTGRGYHVGIDDFVDNEYGQFDDSMDTSLREEGSLEANNYGGYADVDGFMGCENEFSIDF